MRIFISTGEVSGDLQGALLVEALHQEAQRRGLDLEIVALGGDRMAEAGAQIIANTAQIGSIGLFESIPFVLPTLQAQKRARQVFREQPPDVLVLIDYHDPNIALARVARKQLPHLPIFYYIAPQSWVWAPTLRSTQEIVTLTDRILAIFPQEATFFTEQGAKVQWVGHPIVDRMQQAPSREEARQRFGFEPEQKVVTLLPASRWQEIKFLLPPMLEAAQQLQEKIPNLQFLLPLSLNIYEGKIGEILAKYDLNLKVLQNETLEAIAASDLAITKSGTVNLEIALLQVPQVVIYRLHWFTMWLARTFFRFSIPFMSPINLVLMREIVPELLQEKATPERIVEESLDFLLNDQRRAKVVQDYQEMTAALGDVGACERAAENILGLAE
ncbi:lipid-A-disaccharide synthase [Spirulina subsalsa]|uniref:lipid-A-disaccharide synthase n=1 Tax=Spirulina subsalsa TaxID=54311 RepID=UPI0002D94E65|nr:lipid-A-disaccharide synthase [Spirulina subsalsa]